MTEKNQNEEFFIGYQKQMPAGLGRHVRKTVTKLAGAIVLLMILLTVSQRGFYPSVFEFGEIRTFQGTVKEKPYPMLLVKRPSVSGGISRYYLVAAGKWGAGNFVSGLEGKNVELQGTLIYRDDQTMIEVVQGSVKKLGAPAIAIPAFAQHLGIHTLVGEIVDSKCYFGVMNPGDSKVHRSCAVRCISGGIPPVFYVKDEDGAQSYLLLVGSDGRMVNKEVLDLVAKPLEITGSVVSYDNLLVFKAEPGTYREVR